MDDRTGVCEHGDGGVVCVALSDDELAVGGAVAVGVGGRCVCEWDCVLRVGERASCLSLRVALVCDDWQCVALVRDLLLCRHTAHRCFCRWGSVLMMMMMICM